MRMRVPTRCRPFRQLPAIVIIGSVILPPDTLADGFTVDKVYHPYVQPLEREIEWRSLFINDGDETLDGAQVHRLGVGKSFGERLFGEIYLIGVNNPGSDLDLEAWELELKWQLTEQGEFFADWGLLFEFEKENDNDSQEFGTTLLIEKELRQWTATLNLSAIYEWGDDIRNEWESQLAAQMRYRYSRLFEPAIELYSGETTKGIGPVALGDLRFARGRKLHWELGLIFGLDSDSPDQTLRALLEFEF